MKAAGRTIFIAIFLGVFLNTTAWAQSFELVPHYPSSAFVVNRLLPFFIQSDLELTILEIQLKNHESCSSRIDPFLEKTFHIYCQVPQDVGFDVIYKVDGEKLTHTVSNIKILAIEEVVDPQTGSL